MSEKFEKCKTCKRHGREHRGGGEVKKKTKVQPEFMVEISWEQFETLKEIIDNFDMEMFDETKIRIYQKGAKTWGHISGYIEPDPPDNLEEDFELPE
jgi:hypothetical protein